MKSIAEQHQQWCVHYQRNPGMPKREACKVGVVYDDLMRIDELGLIGCALRLPCIRSHHDDAKRKGEPLCGCPHLKWPTEEESEAEQKKWNEHTDKIDSALVLIDPIRKAHRGKDWRGVLECPACKGKLHVQHSGYNNHVRVTCETQDCIAWIE